MTEHATSDTKAPSRTQRELVLVHSDAYIDWKFSDSSATQGRRFTNARDVIVERHQPMFDAGRAVIVEPRYATRDELALVHDRAYIAAVLDGHRCSEWVGERPDLADLAQLLAGGTLVALDSLLRGETMLAVHLAGAKHHAQRDQASGFCVFADFAIAAKVAVSHGLKVAIFDYDAHHGDGTENLCADDPSILTYSIHQRGLFPGTGLSSDPERHIHNVALWPVAAGDIEQRDDHELVRAALDFAGKASEFGADLVLVAAGADGHRNDPLSSLEYDEGAVFKAFGAIKHVLEPMPMLIGGAGGYRPDDDTPSMWEAAVSGAVGWQQAVLRDLRSADGIDISGAARA